MCHELFNIWVSMAQSPGYKWLWFFNEVFQFQARIFFIPTVQNLKKKSLSKNHVQNADHFLMILDKNSRYYLVGCPIRKNFALQWTKKLQKSIVVNSKNLIYFIFHNKGNLFFAFRQLSRKKQKNCSFLIVANKLEAKSYETKGCKIK